MKTKVLLLASIAFMILFASCKKDVFSQILINFSNYATEGTADANGEYTMTGHISSSVSLDKVVLTKQGLGEVFFVDESTAKNKNEYDFSYIVTGINTNTVVIIDVFDQSGGKNSVQFLVRK